MSRFSFFLATLIAKDDESPNMHLSKESKLPEQQEYTQTSPGKTELYVFNCIYDFD